MYKDKEIRMEIAIAIDRVNKEYNEETDREEVDRKKQIALLEQSSILLNALIKLNEVQDKLLR